MGEVKQHTTWKQQEPGLFSETSYNMLAVINYVINYFFQQNYSLE